MYRNLQFIISQLIEHAILNVQLKHNIIFQIGEISNIKLVRMYLSSGTAILLIHFNHIINQTEHFKCGFNLKQHFKQFHKLLLLIGSQIIKLTIKQDMKALFLI